MGTPRRACFLIALLLFARVDNLLVPAPVPPSAALVGDDDEYVLSMREQHPERLAELQKQVSISLKPETAYLSFLRRSALSWSDRATPFSSPLLYIFMSLQC
jgi:hypothetical protein